MFMLQIFYKFLTKKQHIYYLLPLKTRDNKIEVVKII